MEFQYEPHRIYANDANGELIGEIVFPAVENDQPLVVVERTFVNPKYRGQNIAQQLVESFVGYAALNHYQVKLMCPYAKMQFGKHKDYQQLLPESDRF